MENFPNFTIKWFKISAWYYTVKPLITNTSKEIIKCRILQTKIIWNSLTLFPHIHGYLFIKLIEKLSRRHLINSSDVFVIKGFTVVFSVFQPRINIKKLSLCHKLISSHPYIFAIDGVNLWYFKLSRSNRIHTVITRKLQWNP